MNACSPRYLLPSSSDDGRFVFRLLAYFPADPSPECEHRPCVDQPCLLQQVEIAKEESEVEICANPRIPKTGSENLAFLIKHLSLRNNFTHYRYKSWSAGNQVIEVRNSGLVKLNLAIWMKTNSWKNNEEFATCLDQHSQTGDIRTFESNVVVVVNFLQIRQL